LSPSTLGTFTVNDVSLDSGGKAKTMFIASTEGGSGTMTATGMQLKDSGGASLPDATTNMTVNVTKVEFTINVTSFIPTNNLQGPPQSRCLVKAIPPSIKRIFLKGDGRGFDPTAASFRTRELVTVITEKQCDADGLKEGSDKKLVGQSRSYAQDALTNAPLGVIDAADDDAVLGDCVLLDAVGTGSNKKMNIVVTRINDHKVSVHMFGAAADPLVLLSADIDWDFTITIDTSGAKPHWTLNGTHDGFPAHEIYINGTAIYTFAPAAPAGTSVVGTPTYTFDQIRALFPPQEIKASKVGDLP